MAGSKNITTQKHRIFHILEELKVNKEELNGENYNWKARVSDPKFESLLDYFVSYAEMTMEFEKWSKTKDLSDGGQDLVLASSVKTEDYLNSTEIDLKKIANFLTGRADTKGSEVELRKIKLLLDNSSKAGNTFLSMMAYRQMERVSKLLDALELAESRLYSKESIQNTKPEYLGFLIERISKTIDSALTFIDRVSNREIEERKKGTHITVNQQINNIGLPSSAPMISQPARESFRALAQRLAKTIEVETVIPEEDVDE